MDLATIITGLVILASVTIPIIYLNNLEKRSQKKLKQLLFNYANAHGCSIYEHDLWNNTAIGIDKSNGLVFYVQKTRGQETKLQVNLSKIQRCKISEITKTIKTGEGHDTVFERLELSFMANGNSPTETSLEFYNTNSSRFVLNGELKLVEKWQKIINDQLSKKSASV